MTLNNFTSGVNTDFSDELNENSAVFLTQSGLNLIRQLQDRGVDFSNGEIDGFAEAYVGENGRRNTVTTNLYGSGAAVFDTDEYIPGLSDVEDGATITEDAFSSNNNAQGWSNPENIRDNDPSTAASASAIDGSFTDTGTYEYYIGFTFSSQYISTFISKFGCFLGGDAADAYVDLETYDGNSWSQFTRIAGGGEVSLSDSTRTYNIDNTIQGIRLYFYDDTGSDFTTIEADVFDMRLGSLDSGIIEHNVTELGSNIQNAIGIPLINNWEDGADIQYKLSNSSGDDTGFLPAGNTPEVSEFTQFSAEPDTLTVKLVPKDTSPSADTPSIKGFYLKTA